MGQLFYNDTVKFFLRNLAVQGIAVKLVIVAFVLKMLLCDAVPAQEGTPPQSSRSAEVELGSKTAKGGFRNEDEIRDKFNHWQTDSDARAWLEAMKYRISEIESVSASKPHGAKADVEVLVTTTSGEQVERISIKLVSRIGKWGWSRRCSIVARIASIRAPFSGRKKRASTQNVLVT